MPSRGEVWLVDLGMTAKIRPSIVLIADNLSAPRSCFFPTVPIQFQPG